MKKAITDGISVTVISKYEDSPSKPDQSIYVFSYKVRIQNQNDFDVQLISRYWRISDSLGGIKEVKGDGVIGNQPIIPSGDFHEYESWCPLQTQIGSMEGYYIMERKIDKSRFKAYIPKFILSELAIQN